mmetsp:Transcript_7186/g.12082  ORF Transcript_7186/g.12082 Transcript_7186/m.12082 type:complete len:209 (-) Transcript_7186:729-1355(-)
MRDLGSHPHPTCQKLSTTKTVTCVACRSRQRGVPLSGSGHVINTYVKQMCQGAARPAAAVSTIAAAALFAAPGSFTQLGSIAVLAWALSSPSVMLVRPLPKVISVSVTLPKSVSNVVYRKAPLTVAAAPLPVAVSRSRLPGAVVFAGKGAALLHARSRRAEMPSRLVSCPTYRLTPPSAWPSRSRIMCASRLDSPRSSIATPRSATAL